MITNKSLTIYHKVLNTTTHLEEWVRYNYANVWLYGGKGAGTNKGYENANNVQIRIPYNENAGLNASNFTIGDIIVEGTLETNITTQQDLSTYTIYNITSIVDDTYSNNKHIHLGGI